MRSVYIKADKSNRKKKLNKTMKNIFFNCNIFIMTLLFGKLE